jgi:hypothetical protein
MRLLQALRHSALRFQSSKQYLRPFNRCWSPSDARFDAGLSDANQSTIFKLALKVASKCLITITEYFPNLIAGSAG